MEIAQIVEQSREGHILLSIPPISPMFAAAILATVGHIANFEDAGHLKSYFEWAPRRAQTGISFDRVSLTKGGSREMKKVMYLIAWKAITSETAWASLYKRLVPRLCSFDEKTQTYKGKGKAIGHVIGRLIGLIYALLRQDYEILSHLPPGTEPPEPILYDAELHKRHRTGHYRPIRMEQVTNRIVQVEPPGESAHPGSLRLRWSASSCSCKLERGTSDAARPDPWLGLVDSACESDRGRTCSSMQSPVASRRGELSNPSQGRHRSRSSLPQKEGLRHEGCFPVIVPHLPCYYSGKV